MSSSRLPNIPSLRKQQLLLEFGSLKYAPPPGVYVSIANPADPTFWCGVIFIQKGPYTSAVLRFNIKFPSTYPELPPVVTFTTDIFHPLIVPLTTYTFTTGSSNETPVSATDEERLSPGAFSLRHGFPHWFGRAQRTASNSLNASRNVSGGSATLGDPKNNQTTGQDSNPSNTVPPPPDAENLDQTATKQSTPETPLQTDPTVRLSKVPAPMPYEKNDTTVHVLTLLSYIRSTFDDEAVLDSLPLDAAGNPGAWHAWKAHRRGITGTGVGTPDKRAAPQARLPGEWNWEGVWAKRVQDGIQASQSDAALFANTRMETDSIRFLNLDPTTLSSIREKLIPEPRENLEG